MEGVRKQRAVQLAKRAGLATVVLMALVALSFVGVGIPCPLYTITGLYCPGCGSMRCISSLAQLNFNAAWGYNKALVLLLPFLLALLVYDSVNYLRGTAKNPVWLTWLCIVLIVSLVVFGILRNLPAFSYLAPAI